MRLGVVIPFYRGEAWLAGAVESAQRASLLHQVIVVVVDDGSPTPVPGDVATQAVPDQLEIVTQANQGVASARNAGFSQLVGRVGAVLFLDQDDRLVPGALDLLSRHLVDGVRAVAGDITLQGPAGPLVRRSMITDRVVLTSAGLVPERSSTISRACLSYRNCLHTPGQVLLDAGGFQQTGGFDPAIAPVDDWGLWYRLSEHALHVVPEVVCLVNVHPDNVSHDNQVMRTLEVALRGRWWRAARGRSRRAVSDAYRRSEREAARAWWEMLRTDLLAGQAPFAVRRAVRILLFLMWSVLGLGPHYALRAASKRLGDPRARRTARSRATTVRQTG